MNRAALLLLAMWVSTGVAHAQTWAKNALEQSPRHQEWVPIKHGDRTVQTFVVYPERKDKAPVVLVIHEIFGLTDWARNVADRLAANGYIAVAPDLLSGMGPNGGRSKDFYSQDAAREANSKLPPEQVAADLNAVADWAKKLPSSDGELAVAGFCWGGGQSFRFATARKDLKAAYVFYGPPPPDLASVSAPVYGFYGQLDNRVTSTVDDTKSAMKGKKYDAVVYPGAGHGFMRTGEDPGCSSDHCKADREAQQQAWQRWLKLLKEM